MKSNTLQTLKTLGDLELSRAQFQDAKKIQSLLEKNKPFINQKTIDELDRLMPHFYTLRAMDGKLLSAVALNPVLVDQPNDLYPNNLSSNNSTSNNLVKEIRGFVIAHEFRKMGLGKYMIQEIIKKVPDQKALVCITRCSEFFAKFGFQECQPFWIEHNREISEIVYREGKTVPLYPNRTAMIFRQSS